MRIFPYTTTTTKKTAVLAKINKLGYVLINSTIKITSQLSGNLEWSVTIVNNVKVKHQKMKKVLDKVFDKVLPTLGRQSLKIFLVG